MQVFPSKNAAHRQTKSLRLVCILAFPSLMNMLTQYLASLLEVLFLRDGLQKYSFQVVSFRNRTYAKSLEICKSFDVDFALCLTKGLCWRLLD